LIHVTPSFGGGWGEEKKPRFDRNGVFQKKGDDILSYITAVLPKSQDSCGLNYSVRAKFYLIFSKKINKKKSSPSK
jgi:hypothetical protein